MASAHQLPIRVRLMAAAHHLPPTNTIPWHACMHYAIHQLVHGLSSCVLLVHAMGLHCLLYSSLFMALSELLYQLLSFIGSIAHHSKLCLQESFGVIYALHIVPSAMHEWYMNVTCCYDEGIVQSVHWQRRACVHC